jgi:hypothetical protein
LLVFQSINTFELSYNNNYSSTKEVIGHRSTMTNNFINNNYCYCCLFVNEGITKSLVEADHAHTKCRYSSIHANILITLIVTSLLINHY